jgi:LysM repeat protein
VKTIAVSRLSFFALVLVLVFAITACERPLQDDKEAAPTELESVEPADEEIEESVYLAPGDSTVLVDPDDAGAIEGAGETEPITAEPTVDPLAVEAPVEPVTHTIAAGDSLFTIAQFYNVSIDDLAAANNLDINAILDLGTTLIIPVEGEVVAGGAASEGSALEAVDEAGERIHIVQAGENLYRIGLIYGFTIEELATYNGMTNPDVLDVGQELRIPPG